MPPAIKNQAKLAAIAFAAALSLTFAFSPAVNAASDRQECEAAGGTYEKVQGVSSCTFLNEPPNQPNPGGVSKTEEEEQKGSFKSSHPREEEDCVNNRGGSHCR